MVIQPRIDKTDKRDLLDLQQKFADLFEDNPISLEEFEETAGDYDSYITYSTGHLAKFLISEFSLEHVITRFAAEQIVLAVFKDWCVIRDLFNHKVRDVPVLEMIFQGVRVKRDPRLIKASMEDEFPYRSFRGSTIVKPERIEGHLNDSGYYLALEKSPCCITDYLRKPVKTWANDPDIDADPVAVYEREQELRANRRKDKIKREIASGIRHEDGSLVNPLPTGAPTRLSAEEALENRRRSNANYYAKRKAAQIEAGLRNPDGSLVNPGRIGRRPIELSPEEELAKAEATLKYAREYAAKRRKKLVDAQIAAGIRDANGKLIK